MTYDDLIPVLRKLALEAGARFRTTAPIAGSLIRWTAPWKLSSGAAISQ